MIFISIFLQYEEAWQRVGVCILKLATCKVDVSWQKEINQIIEKYRVMDKFLKQRLESRNIYVCEQHYKKEEIEFKSALLHALLLSSLMSFV